MSNDISNIESLPDISGSYDNFLQIWKEQTEDEIHRDKSGFNHEHIHVQFINREYPHSYEVIFYRGRNNQELLSKKKITFATDSIEQDNEEVITLIHSNGAWSSKDSSVSIISDGTSITINGLGVYAEQKTQPYHLLKCRFFSGFIEYPIPDSLETVHRLGNLEIHDQGGMVELDYEGIDYTIELTQLVFAHKIKLMKIAIYDLPLDKVEINSKAISYAWTSPDSTRLGINIRKLISGWTFIEEGFLSSNNMDIDS